MDMNDERERFRKDLEKRWSNYILLTDHLKQCNEYSGTEQKRCFWEASQFVRQQFPSCDPYGDIEKFQECVRGNFQALTRKYWFVYRRIDGLEKQRQWRGSQSRIHDDVAFNRFLRPWESLELLYTRKAINVGQEFLILPDAAKNDTASTNTN